MTPTPRGSAPARVVPIRRLLGACLVAALVAGSPAVAPPARAQQAAGFELDLVSQPVWHVPGDRINVRVRITNHTDATLDGFNMAVGAFRRIVTRSGLHSSFDLTDQEAPDAFPLSLPNAVVGPQESVTVRIDEPLSNFSLLSNAEAGVYPLKVILQDGAGLPLDTLTTQLLLYPQPPDVALKAVVVLPLDLMPQRGPDGVFHPDENGDYPLESALDGHLGALGPALERATDPPDGDGLQLALAPAPVLIEELADMADGYPRAEGEENVEVGADAAPALAAADFLTALRDVVAGGSVQTLPVPYATPDLPSIAGLPDAVDEQLEAGFDVIAERLGIDVDRDWVYGAGARLDRQSLGQAGVEHTFFSADALVPPDDPLTSGCPEPELSFTCPVTATTPIGDRVTGYVVDNDLQRALLDLPRPGDTRLELQRFFSETAMIREEQPSNSDRIIQVTIPGSWQPTGSQASLLLSGLRRAPWLESVTPERGLALTRGSAAERRLVAQAPVVADQPDDLFFDEVARVSELVTHFDSMEPPDEMVRRLGRNTLIAQSRSWWDDPQRGREFLSETEQEINRELAKIGILGGPEGEIALTSREGEIPLTLFRNTGYDVRVNIVLDSSRLELERNVLEQEIDGPRERVIFAVVARSSGQFPLDVRLTTPDGYAFGDVRRLTIRSTAFNEIALGITFGALAFLISFYVVRVIRRRRDTGGGLEKAESP